MLIDRDRHAGRVTPRWFKIRSYDDLEDLDECGWYLQFACRRMLSQLVEVEAGTEKRLLNTSDFSHKLFEQLCFRPIAKTDDIAAIDFPLGLLNLIEHAPALKSARTNLLGVRPTTVTELFEHQALLDPAFRQRAHRYFSNLDHQTTSSEHSFQMLAERRRIHLLNKMQSSVAIHEGGAQEASPESRFDEPVFASQTLVPPALIFTVNPMLPTELLVEQFRTALAQSRAFFADTGYQFQERDEQFDRQRGRWTKYLVLQFLDLKKGLELTREQVTDEEVWRILSRACQDAGIEVELDKDDSTLRKTNRVSAMEMMEPFSWRFAMLEARVAALNSEKPGSMVPGQDQKLAFEDRQFRQYRKK